MHSKSYITKFVSIMSMHNVGAIMFDISPLNPFVSCRDQQMKLKHEVLQPINQKSFTIQNLECFLFCFNHVQKTSHTIYIVYHYFMYLFHNTVSDMKLIIIKYICTYPGVNWTQRIIFLKQYLYIDNMMKIAIDVEIRSIERDRVSVLQSYKSK